MKAPATIESTIKNLGNAQVDSQLHQAVMDALPDALFLLDLASSVIQPLNIAARRWMPDESFGEVAVPVAQVFPELNVTALSSAIVSATSISSQSAPLMMRAIDKTTGAHHELELQFHPLGDAAQAKILIVARTLSNLLAGEDSSRRNTTDDAFHDPLTRLANRRLFDRRLERAIDRASQRGYHFAVLFVDLDRFKEVNDRFGHVQGDYVLVAAAHRLLEAVRPQDMVARRDGDEFTILLDDLERPEDAVHVAKRIVERLQMPLSTEGPDATIVTIGASVGIAMASDATQTANELIARADAAMYHAKSLGGGTYATFDRIAEAGREKPLPR